jgi:hypothetical protein
MTIDEAIARIKAEIPDVINVKSEIWKGTCFINFEIPSTKVDMEFMFNYSDGELWSPNARHHEDGNPEPDVYMLDLFYCMRKVGHYGQTKKAQSTTGQNQAVVG